MQTWQGSLGKKFTVGGGGACMCALRALNTARGNDLARTQKGTAHGNNLKPAEHGF